MLIARGRQLMTASTGVLGTEHDASASIGLSWELSGASTGRTATRNEKSRAEVSYAEVKPLRMC